MEMHGMTAQEINQESEWDDDDYDATQKYIESEEETDLESSDAKIESSYDDECSTSQLIVNIVTKCFLFKGILMLM